MKKSLTNFMTNEERSKLFVYSCLISPCNFKFSYVKCYFLSSHFGCSLNFSFYHISSLFINQIHHRRFNPFTFNKYINGFIHLSYLDFN